MAGPSRSTYAGVVAARTPAAPKALPPFSLLTRQLGVKCYAHPDMSIEACAKAMAGVVGPSAIVAASKMYGRAVFFLKAERAVHLALEKGLTVGGTFLAVDPLEATAHKIVISNVPPFLPVELLLPHLHLLGGGQVWGDADPARPSGPLPPACLLLPAPGLCPPGPGGVEGGHSTH